MPPKKSKSVVATTAGAAPIAAAVGGADIPLPPLEVYMDVMSSQLGTANAAAPTEVGRLIFRLSRQTHPRTCDNFRLLALGTVIPADKKPTKEQKIFSYVNTPFTRVTEDGIQGGNIHRLFDPIARQASVATHSNSISARTASPPSGAGGPRSSSPSAGATKASKNEVPESQLQSVYGPVFADEAKGSLQVGYGSLLMASAGPNTNGCQFFVCTKRPNPADLILTHEAVAHLGKNYVAFGELVEGAEVLELVASGMAAMAPADRDDGDVRGAPIVYYVGACGVVGFDPLAQAAATSKR